MKKKETEAKKLDGMAQDNSENTIEKNKEVHNKNKTIQKNKVLSFKERALQEREMPNNEAELLQILNAQNDILDCMLTQQKKIHGSIKARQWLELERSINNMKAYSDAFVNLDQCREEFVGDNKDIYLSPEVESVFLSVRTKLSKSKIENSALATYVSSTKEFIDGVLDACIPKRRNVLYNNMGRIVRPAAESVVIDTVF